jgi:hypothetical protein
MRSILLLVLLITIGGFCLHLQNFGKIHSSHSLYHIASPSVKDKLVTPIPAKKAKNSYEIDRTIFDPSFYSTIFKQGNDSKQFDLTGTMSPADAFRMDTS